MIETFFATICDYAHSAHWMLFGLLLLSGLNIPISEDLLLMIAGVIASTCIPDHTLHLFVWVYMGAWLSAWIAYWIGRVLGPKLYEIHWFRKIISPKRIEKLHSYYERFGIFTFIVGRFFPGGMRNALFMSSGLGKMPFLKFIVRDGVACLLSSSVLFFIGFWIGNNYASIKHFLSTYDEVVLLLVCVAVLGVAAYFWFCRKINRGQKT